MRLANARHVTLRFLPGACEPDSAAQWIVLRHVIDFLSAQDEAPSLDCNNTRILMLMQPTFSLPRFYPRDNGCLHPFVTARSWPVPVPR